MTKEEIKEYLISTGLYENTDTDMFYEEEMMSSDEAYGKRKIRKTLRVDYKRRGSESGIRIKEL